MNAQPMTREYAEMYATALLVGAGQKGAFEISFPNSLDTVLVAQALEQLGCTISWDRFNKFVTVSPPPLWKEHAA